MNKVLIVLLNFNNEPDTLECLKSLKILESVQFETVLIDNASEGFARSDLHIYCIDNDINIIENGENLGFGAGNNAILKYADINRYEWIWFLNNDTIVKSDSLYKMLACGESNANIGAVGCTVIYFDSFAIQSIGGGYIKYNSIPRHIKHRSDLKNIQYITGASLLIKRELFQELEGFRREYFMYWEDVDLSFRIRDKGYSLATAVDAVVRHKESATSNSKSLFFFYHFFRSAAIFFGGKSDYRFAVFSIYFILKSLKDGNIRNAIAGLLHNLGNRQYVKK